MFNKLTKIAQKILSPDNAEYSEMKERVVDTFETLFYFLSSSIEKQNTGKFDLSFEINGDIYSLEDLQVNLDKIKTLQNENVYSLYSDFDFVWLKNYIQLINFLMENNYKINFVFDENDLIKDFNNFFPIQLNNLFRDLENRLEKFGTDNKEVVKKNIKKLILDNNNQLVSKISNISNERLQVDLNNIVSMTFIESLLNSLENASKMANDLTSQINDTLKYIDERNGEFLLNKSLFKNKLTMDLFKLPQSYFFTNSFLREMYNNEFLDHNDIIIKLLENPSELEMLLRDVIENDVEFFKDPNILSDGSKHCMLYSHFLQINYNIVDFQLKYKDNGDIVLQLNRNFIDSLRELKQSCLNSITENSKLDIYKSKQFFITKLHGQLSKQYIDFLLEDFLTQQKKSVFFD